MWLAFVVGERVRVHEPRHTELRQDVRWWSHPGEGIRRIPCRDWQLDVRLGERRDLPLLGDAEPTRSGRLATPPLDRRDTPALDCGVEHVSGEAQQPLNRFVAAGRGVPLQPRRRERLSSEVVGERWVSDAAEEDSDEASEPALGKWLEGARFRSLIR
jgi:hypothetical protein